MKLPFYIVLIESVLWLTISNGSQLDTDYQLSGFKKYESVPVQFPRDICIFLVDDIQFAASLHYQTDMQLEFVLFKKDKNDNYTSVYNRSTPLAIDMDCISMGSKGYVALAFNLSQPVSSLTEGAPLFEVTGSEISIVQFFGSLHQNRIYLRNHKFKLYLIQTHRVFDDASENSVHCPIYGWSDYHFNYIDQIPCANAKHIEPFIVGDSTFVMVANYGNIENYDQHATSFLYRYRDDEAKFVEHQRFRTSEAADVKYFHITDKDEIKQHFIIVANEVSAEAANLPSDVGTPSVIYKFKSGIFVPVQQLYFHNATQFLPVNVEKDKFVLLVACESQDVKFLKYEEQQFKISKVQLTDGAFTKGVRSMRTLTVTNKTYIVIANERMLMDETNVYLPLYKIKENRTNLRLEMLQRFQNLQNKLTNSSFATKMKYFEHMVQNFTDGFAHFKNIEVKKAVVKLLSHPKLNLTRQYWGKLALATKALRKLEEKLEALASRTQDSTNNDGTYGTLKLKKLVVTDSLMVNTINNKSLSNLSIDTISADTIILKGNYTIKQKTQASPESDDVGSEHANRKVRETDFPEIHAKHIVVSGMVNGLNLSEFRNRILKTTGNQVITTSLNFTKLDVKSLQVNGVVNGENPSKVIAVNGGNYVVDQELIFYKSPIVNHLVINNRLNHIGVDRGRLKVLYKNETKLQTITGSKKFNNVRLLEPFSLRGKIYSPRLDQINPVAVISEDIDLEGDYEISGQVLVSNSITATNYYGASLERNVLEILENGLSVKTPTILQNVHFRDSINANNVKTIFINDLDTSDFVVNDNVGKQVVTGTKIFNNDVHISKGSCDVSNVNGINIRKLYESRLRKFGEQTIDGHLQFRSIRSTDMNSIPKIILNGTYIEDILTLSTPQVLTDVTIGHLSADSIKSTNFYSNLPEIFGNNVNFLVRDTVMKGSSPKITGAKIFKGNLTAPEIFIAKTINSHSAQALHESLQSMNNDEIQIEGDIIVDDAAKIQQLTVEGELNGISAKKFGTCWLLSEGDQTFTAPQMFEKLRAKDVHVAGNINGHNMNHIMNNVYWLDREEDLPSASFAKVVAEKDFITDGHINDMNFGESVLLTDSSVVQVIEAPVTCEGDITSTGQIKDLRIFNKIDLANLSAILHGHSESAKLTVDSATFENNPEIHLLNGYDLDNVSNSIWFSNEDTVLHGEVAFSEAEIKSYVDVDGPVNGVDLETLEQHYFSLTKPQRVSTPIIFKGPVIFEDSLSTETMELSGIVKDTVSGKHLNISDFSRNVLRKDMDQKITGDLKISTVIVQGDLNHVHINGLRLYDDVLRRDIPFTQNITAPKNFTKLSVVDLECTSRARINSIDILDWLRNSVFSYGNYTIQGTTTVDNIMLYEDVTVHGTVNSVKFDDAHLLLVDTDQTIYGNVVMKTIFEKKNRIMPLSIEHLNVASINDVNIDSFFSSIVPFNDSFKAKGNFIFKTPPIVKKFHSDRGLFSVANSTEGAVRTVEMLLDDHQNLVESFKEKASFLSHYILQQKLTGKIQQILGFKALTGLSIENRIAVLRGDKDPYITFHKWNPTKQFFDLDHELFTWIAKNLTIVHCNKITVQNGEVLVIQTFNNHEYMNYFIASTKQDLQLIFQLNSNQSEGVIPVVYKEQQCFLFHAKYYSNLVLQCMKMSSAGNVELVKELVLYTKDVVMQLLSLLESLFIVATRSSVDVWDINSESHPIASIPIANVVSMSLASFENDNYLAVNVNGKFIEIFRSSNGSATFSHFQSITQNDLVKMEFATIGSANDLHLYTLSTDEEYPLIGYVLQGILGFRQFFQPINLKRGKNFDIISLEEHNKHFISYEMEDEVQVLQAIVLRT